MFFLDLPHSNDYIQIIYNPNMFCYDCNSEMVRIVIYAILRIIILIIQKPQHHFQQVAINFIVINGSDLLVKFTQNYAKQALKRKQN
jgi:hypothetical protein